MSSSTESSFSDADESGTENCAISSSDYCHYSLRNATRQSLMSHAPTSSVTPANDANTSSVSTNGRQFDFLQYLIRDHADQSGKCQPFVAKRKCESKKPTTKSVHPGLAMLKQIKFLPDFKASNIKNFGKAICEYCGLEMEDFELLNHIETHQHNMQVSPSVSQQPDILPVDPIRNGYKSGIINLDSFFHISQKSSATITDQSRPKETIKCPLCNYARGNATDLMDHVNRFHGSKLDLSPEITDALNAHVDCEEPDRNCDLGTSQPDEINTAVTKQTSEFTIRSHPDASYVTNADIKQEPLTDYESIPEDSKKIKSMVSRRLRATDQCADLIKAPDPPDVKPPCLPKEGLYSRKQCLLCSYVTNKSTSLLYHIKSHGDQSRTNQHVDEIVSRIARNPWPLDDSLKLLRKRQDIDKLRDSWLLNEKQFVKVQHQNTSRKYPRPTRPLRYPCIFCKNSYYNYAMWKLHVENGHLQTLHSVYNHAYKCPTCGFTAVSKRDLTAHSVHCTSSSTHYCPLCNYQTKRLTDLNFHTSLQHNTSQSSASGPAVAKIREECTTVLESEPPCDDLAVAKIKDERTRVLKSETPSDLAVSKIKKEQLTTVLKSEPPPLTAFIIKTEIEDEQSPNFIVASSAYEGEAPQLPCFKAYSDVPNTSSDSNLESLVKNVEVLIGNIHSRSNDLAIDKVRQVSKLVGTIKEIIPGSVTS